MITTTTAKYIDFSFAAKPFEGRALGLKKPTKLQQRFADAGIPFFADAYPQFMIPASQQKDMILAFRDKLRKTITQIYDQKSVSSCVGFGSAQMTEVTFRRVYGLPYWVSLSGMHVYGRIASSSRSGAYIPDGMDAVLQGVLPADTPENKEKYPITMTRDVWTPESRFPANHMSVAKLFRGRSFVKASGVDMIISALIYEKCGIVGRDMHCVPYCFPEYYKNERLAAYPNSWSPEWGDQGIGYDSTRVLNNITCYFLMDVVTRPDLEIPEA